MERLIGVYSKLIKPKSKGGRNVSFLVEHFAIHNYTNTPISVHDEINIIQPKPYGRESYMYFSNDPSGAQLKKNEISRGNHYVMFTCPYRNNCNAIFHSWLIGIVQFFFHHKDSHGSLHFLALVEVIKEHDAAGQDSSVPIVRQRPQSSRTPGRQTNQLIQS